MRRRATIASLLPSSGLLTACHSKPEDKATVKDIHTKAAATGLTQDSRVAVSSHRGFDISTSAAAQNIRAPRIPRGC